MLHFSFEQTDQCSYLQTKKTIQFFFLNKNYWYTKTVNRFERALIGYSNFEYPLAIISDLLARGLHPKVLLLLQEQKKIRTFVAPYYHCYSVD